MVRADGHWDGAAGAAASDAAPRGTREDASRAGRPLALGWSRAAFALAGERLAAEAPELATGTRRSGITRLATRLGGRVGVPDDGPTGVPAYASFDADGTFVVHAPSGERTGTAWVAVAIAHRLLHWPAARLARPGATLHATLAPDAAGGRAALVEAKWFADALLAPAARVEAAARAWPADLAGLARSLGVTRATAERRVRDLGIAHARVAANDA